MEQKNQPICMEALVPVLLETIEEGKTAELVITGNSMNPMLLHQVSRVKLAAPGAPKRGDLVLYRRDNGAFVLHRIVKVTQEQIICCGDNQWHLEKGLQPGQILARVTAFARQERWVCCDSKGYGMYWRFWLLIRPLRHLVIGGFRRLARK